MSSVSAADLLDPKNDYVFKRIFGEDPSLLVALINDLRPDLPEIRAVEILNPGIRAEELRGKYIMTPCARRSGSTCWTSTFLSPIPNNARKLSGVSRCATRINPKSRSGTDSS
ncbi:hypothetical protein [Thiocystis violascens]